MSDAETLPSLEGRAFTAVADMMGGVVGPETLFRCHQSGREIWASYASGALARGFLVGTRDGAKPAFRSVQLSGDGTTSSGRCVSTLSRTAAGRLRLDETWQWESRTGEGRSAVEETG